jgi:hypothetical protein
MLCAFARHCRETVDNKRPLHLGERLMRSRDNIGAALDSVRKTLGRRHPTPKTVCHNVAILVTLAWRPGKIAEFYYLFVKQFLPGLQIEVCMYNQDEVRQ